jgi:adenylate kinase family enzyme
MRRIAILGCSGSGKSTLAMSIGERLNLPVVHLDNLYWLPGWREPSGGAHRPAFAAAFAEDAWVSDGNFIETLDLRLPRTDAVIILDRPRWLCLWRVLWRACFARFERADLPDGCPEQFDWALLQYVWRYDAVNRPRLEAALRARQPNPPVIRLRRERDITAFLATLSRAPPSPGP